MKFRTLLSWAGELLHRTKVRHISPQEVRRRFGAGEMMLFDATMPAQWQRGHIAGAVYVGFDDQYDPALLPADKEKMLVFYCESAI